MSNIFMPGNPKCIFDGGKSTIVFYYNQFYKNEKNKTESLLHTEVQQVMDHLTCVLWYPTRGCQRTLLVNIAVQLMIMIIVIY